MGHEGRRKRVDVLAIQRRHRGRVEPMDDVVRERSASNRSFRRTRPLPQSTPRKRRSGDGRPGGGAPVFASGALRPRYVEQRQLPAFSLVCEVGLTVAVVVVARRLLDPQGMRLHVDEVRAGAEGGCRVDDAARLPRS